MPGVNLSNLVREQPQLSLFDLFKAISARRTQMRDLADSVLYDYELYKHALKSIENPGKAGVLEYSDLDQVNKDGAALTQLLKRLTELQSGIRGYCYKLGEALPRATEDLIRRGNVISFNNPESAGTTYLLTYAENDTTEYVVELLAAGEASTRALQDTARMRSSR